MTLRIPAKVLLHVWSYDFYDMTLSTGNQRRHMISTFNIHMVAACTPYGPHREKAGILPRRKQRCRSASR